MKSINLILGAAVTMLSTSAVAAPAIYQGPGSLAYARTPDAYLTTFVEWDGIDLDLVAMRLKPDGNPLDTTPIVLAANYAGGGFASVASDGRDFLVVYDVRDGGSLQKSRTYGQLVDGVTGAARGAAFALDDGTQPRFDPKVAWTGAGYVVAYSEQQGTGWRVAGTGVSQAGAVASLTGKTYGTTSGAGGLDVAIAAHGGEAVVTWDDIDPSGVNSVWAAVVKPSGALRVARQVATAPGRVLSNAAVSTGDDVWLVWSELGGENGQTVRRHHGMRVDGALATTLPRTLLGGGTNALDTALVRRDDGRIAMAWIEYDSSGTRTTASQGMLEPAGTVTARLPVSSSAGERWGLRLGTNGTTHVVTWVDLRDYATSSADLWRASTSASAVVAGEAALRR